MADSTIWWLLAGAAVAVELLTGTFYLLMIAIGLAAGALAAHAGAAPTVQLLVAAAICSGAVTAWHLLRPKRSDAPTGSNRDVNQDVGATIEVPAWESDGTASVKYRGAQWTVVAAPGENPQAGAHRVREVVGSRLVVEKI
ncbi:NfeD family protein [Ideonella sp.]|uniref:NfeD family protein n=1 Tax=Ideonella sp. TaxID=1929293 RepID=UPI00351B784B